MRLASAWIRFSVVIAQWYLAQQLDEGRESWYGVQKSKRILVGQAQVSAISHNRYSVHDGGSPYNN